MQDRGLPKEDPLGHWATEPSDVTQSKQQLPETQKHTGRPPPPGSRQPKLLRGPPIYDLNLNPPPLPTYSSGLAIAVDKSFPLGVPPLLELPELSALPSKPLSKSTCGGVAARVASLPSPRAPGDTTSVSELFWPLLLSPAPRKDPPLRAKASPTVTVVGVLSRRSILPLGSSRGVRRFPRFRWAAPPPDGSLGGGVDAKGFARCVHEEPSAVPLLRREGRLRLWTQLLDAGRLCIDARLDFEEGKRGVPSSFRASFSSSSSSRESGR